MVDFELILRYRNNLPGIKVYNCEIFFFFEVLFILDCKITFWALIESAATSEVTTLTIVVMSSLKRLENRALRGTSCFCTLSTYWAMLFTLKKISIVYQMWVCKQRQIVELKEFTHCEESFLYISWNDNLTFLNSVPKILRLKWELAMDPLNLNVGFHSKILRCKI